MTIKMSRATAVRVLVVEDFAAFREFICLALATRLELQIVAEVAANLNWQFLDLDPHLESRTGATIPFGTQDNGGDIVEIVLQVDPGRSP